MRRRRLALWLGLPTALAAGAALLADRIVGAERARIVSPEGAPDAPVAIVLGAGVWEGGTPSAVLEDRLRTACDLYRAGKARALLVSGDHGRAGYDEPGPMARYAEERGVPPEAIFLDHAGFDTYATIYRARRVFQVERALVVTQDFHLPRALFSAPDSGGGRHGRRSRRSRGAARSCGRRARSPPASKH